MSKRPREALDQVATDLARLGAFSDGVFAIAITLLALEIRFPELEPGVVAQQFPSLLAAALPSILAFVFSFAFIGVYWVAHHRTFLFIERGDTRLLWLNLLFIAFLPVPSALVMRYPQQPVVMTFYLACIIFVSLSQLLLWRYASHRHRLVSTSLGTRFIRHLNLRAAVPAVAALLSLGLYLIWPFAVYAFGFLIMGGYVLVGRSYRAR